MRPPVPHASTRPNSLRVMIPLVVVSLAVLQGAVIGVVPASAATTNALTPQILEGASIRAGATNKEIAINYLSNGAQTGTVSIKIPKPESGTPWTTPQSSNTSGPGYVRAGISNLQCATANLKSITGASPGPFYIRVTFDCSSGGTFLVYYGANNTATAPTRAAGYTFQSKFAAPGGAYTALATQPVIRVRAGPAASLKVTAPDEYVIKGQTLQEDILVDALDVYGNLARSFTDTAALSYYHWCQGIVGTGVEPPQVQITKGHGAVVWTPPHIVNDPCVDAHGHTIRPNTTTTATSGALTGQDITIVSYHAPASGASDTSCSGNDGWTTTVNSQAVVVCSFTISNLSLDLNSQVIITGSMNVSGGGSIPNAQLSTASFVDLDSGLTVGQPQIQAGAGDTIVVTGLTDNTAFDQVHVTYPTAPVLGYACDSSGLACSQAAVAVAMKLTV